MCTGVLVWPLPPVWTERGLISASRASLGCLGFGFFPFSICHSVRAVRGQLLGRREVEGMLAFPRP